MSEDGSFEKALDKFRQDSLYEFHQIPRSDRSEMLMLATCLIMD
jgi:hypothetical protein